MNVKKARGAAAPAAALAAILVAAGAFAGWHVNESVSGSATSSAGEQMSALKVTVDCDGWTEANVKLGAFVSGVCADGSSFDEQLVVDVPNGPASTLAAPTGWYQIAPCVPQLMIEDGTVLAAQTVSCRHPEGADGEQSTILPYDVVDMSCFTDEELVEIARSSFVDEAAAAGALERAKVLRAAAPPPDLATPDIDGSSPRDVPGPLALLGGE